MMVTLIDSGGFRLRVSPFLALVWMGAILSGRTALFAAAYLCVTAHELAHAAALRAFHLQVHRIDLTPVGATLSCEAGLEHHPGAEAAMAFAGPALNLLLALGLHLMMQNGLSIPWGDLFIRLNLALALGNLIPALPMDGGHILRAALARHMGLGLACRVTAYLGILLAAGFLALGIYLAAAQALFRAELFFLPALFLLHAKQGLLSASWMALSQTEGKRRELLASGLLPIRHAAIDESVRLRLLLPRLTPRCYHIFTVIGAGGTPLGTLTEEGLLRGLRSKNPLTAGEMVRNACGMRGDMVE